MSDKLLIVEDDPGLRGQMRWALSEHQPILAGDRPQAMAAVRRDEPAVVVLDLGLPPDAAGAGEGLALIEAILAFRPATKIIVASGNEDRANAVAAIGMGAWDFFQKPVDPEALGLTVRRAFHVARLEGELARLGAGLRPSPLAGVIAASPEMLKVCRAVERVGSSNVGVLLTGESGTGKEVLAQALHGLSPRAKMPFVAINCAAIPETLLESELFGHERGAFTGAVKQTEGKIEQAQGGTLFLDEIGDMPAPLQAKLLRFLQNRSFERIGGRRSIAVDVRLISATNRDLAAMMAAGTFREDLFWRLNEVGIHIPPLRDRDGDAVLLARFYLARFARALDRPLRGFTSEALAAIAAHPWPGNVRELENRVKRAVVMAEGKLVGEADLDLPRADGQGPVPTLRQAREQAELGAVTRALALADGNISEAAKLLGVSRPTLYDLMNSLNLKRKEQP
ncbi:MAG: PEP-CTERM-box response regulator transcription factor [Alphaproteobacteria bacterium]|nr:PEP-CTERM-box response regulator transcription factor [Alphaproteobacteria bacterium]